MNYYLLFRLYGPMAAWGDTAVGEFRPSQSHPSRTAVLGILAAALGIRRDQEDELIALDGSVHVAIRLDMPGEPLRDYHTTQVAPAGKKLHYYTRADETASTRLHTILSQRDYRTDCGASVALQPVVSDPSPLRSWQEALRSPALPLYLGRKSCPLALPTDPNIIEAENYRAAFDQYPGCEAQLVAERWLHDGVSDSPIRYFWEGEDNSLWSSMSMSYPRRDHLLSRRRWQFGTRNEHQANHAREDSAISDKES